MPTKRKKAKSKAKPLTINQVNDTDIIHKIILSFNDKKYRYRTIDGVAHELNVTPEVVIGKIRNDDLLKKDVKLAPFVNQDGKSLYTTRERFSKEASLSEKFIDLFSTSKRRG